MSINRFEAIPLHRQGIVLKEHKGNKAFCFKEISVDLKRNVKWLQNMYLKSQIGYKNIKNVQVFFCQVK